MTKKNQKSLFEKLMNVDVSKYVTEKPVSRNSNLKLDYLNWSVAYTMMMKLDPKATLKFKDFPEYDFQSHQLTGRKVDFCDTANGCYVEAIVTFHGITRKQTLPVMGIAKNFRGKFVNNQTLIHPTMTAINKAKQRCFVKCLAKFGLGLKLYGLKNTVQYESQNNNNNYYNNGYQNNRYNSNNKRKASQKQINFIKKMLNYKKSDGSEYVTKLQNNVANLNEMNTDQASKAITYLMKLKNKPKSNSSKSSSSANSSAGTSSKSTNSYYSSSKTNNKTQTVPSADDQKVPF